MRGVTIYEHDDVKEAIKLPENLYNDNLFCIQRAVDLTIRLCILSKEQWTKYEQDKFYFALYLKEVIWERKEWAKK
ncbi:cytochrome b-c1 complex subunit 7-like [Leopardus geoffroyi]|uniref:cytochrome b-c1 complex subunit 7-like n=1 Tax=Leopardus geoffroyi TaxID=46844 RepID=UPI001E25E559|nr:cytochrome b-c1 complex subunit 7-like [Leopardus geoffroyi]